jgi:hypothetical protein
MMSVVVLMVISSLYLNIILSLFMIQQTLSHVCRRTNNYLVTLLCTSVSSFLLQMNRRCYRHRDLSLVSLKEGENIVIYVLYNKN